MSGGGLVFLQGLGVSWPHAGAEMLKAPADALSGSLQRGSQWF
jgi:hypothetical protein